ncbi:hypothetical protein RUND412_005024 [Rhizina undulata]
MDALLPHIDPIFAVLRPYITPYTSTLPPIIAGPLSELLTPTCYAHLITNFDPLSSPSCTSLAISKAIGIGIITLSTIIKLPQLLKLLSSGSSKGLSFASYALETSAYLITLAYNFRAGNPFSTYGEMAMIVVQNIIIGALILHFSKKDFAAAAWVAGVAAVIYVLGGGGSDGAGLLDAKMLGTLQAATIPLGLASKFPQIWTVTKNKSTGQLSAFAVFNYLAGSLARVFTTLAEVNDPLILTGFLCGAFLNFVLAAQMLWFWNAGAKPAAAAGKSKKHFTPNSKAKGKK